MKIKREEYLEKIRPFLGKPIVKAITGLRRVGKSVFIRKVLDMLKKSGFAERNIIYVDLESLKFDFIKNYRDLNCHIEETAMGVAGKLYVFVDEIQDVEGWEKTVSSWSGEPERYDVTITGSNSTLFSGGLATKLTGRYIEFPIYPLSFREFKLFFPEAADTGKLFEQYLRFGGLPGLHTLTELTEETVFPFLEAIQSAIVLKDIVDRAKIRNVANLTHICRFVYDNIGQTLNAQSISKYLKNQHLEVNVQTTINYLEALVESQLFYRAHRYDIKGKRQLELNSKFYAADLGLRNAQIGFRSDDIAQMMENLVYFELCRRGYRVYVGQLDKYEVNFIAEKHGRPHYFQVTLNMAESATMERETRSLLAIDDNYPKTIITLESAYGDGIKGIEVTGLSDFLLRSS